MVDPNTNAVPIFELGTNQVITTSGTSAATASSIGKDIVRIVASEDSYIEFGVSPTATTSSYLVLGGIVEYFKTDPSFKVAAIQKDAAGEVHVSTCL